MKINAHYRGHVKAWHESGLNQANYCRQQGINPRTFSRWVLLDRLYPETLASHDSLCGNRPLAYRQ